MYLFLYQADFLQENVADFVYYGEIIMINDRIDLYDYFRLTRKNATGGYLTSYVRTPSREIKRKIRPAMLVLPGGGYSYLSEHEGEPVALQYMAAGYSSFALEYSINTAYPIPLVEACMAVVYLRENAERYYIDKEKIAVIGFSAGGHLAGLLATVREEEISEILGERAKYARPDGAVLSYPVVTMTDGITHDGTRRVISGNGTISYDQLSVEKRVTSDSAPAFIWHTFEDRGVPVENSLLLASAYKNAGVSFSLHIFEKGWHGLSLCNEETNNQTSMDIALKYVGKWFELSLDWLFSRGFKVNTEEK